MPAIASLPASPNGPLTQVLALYVPRLFERLAARNSGMSVEDVGRCADGLKPETGVDLNPGRCERLGTPRQLIRKLILARRGGPEGVADRSWQPGTTP